MWIISVTLLALLANVSSGEDSPETGILKGIGSGISRIVQSVKNFTTSIVDSVKNTFSSGIGRTISMDALNLTRNLTDSIRILWDNSGNKTKSYEEFFQRKIKECRDSIPESSLKIIDGMVQKILVTVETQSRSLGKVFSKLENDMTGAYASLTTEAQKAFAEIINAFSNFVKSQQSQNLKNQ